MQKVMIVCVGRLKEAYLRDACAEYAKRMGRFASFSVIEADEEKMPDNPSQAQIDAALKKEGERILSRIPSGARIITMCIEGKMLSSEQLSAELDSAASSGAGTVVFVIGGSWGLSEQVKAASSLRLSMSRMTFPHQLARVMLCEQIYRAFQISTGGKYHK